MKKLCGEWVKSNYHLHGRSFLPKSNIAVGQHVEVALIKENGIVVASFDLHDAISL